MNQASAMLMSKYDEGLATCRGLIERSEDGSVNVLLERMMNQMRDGTDQQAIVAAYAVVGLLATMISMEQTP